MDENRWWLTIDGGWRRSEARAGGPRVHLLRSRSRIWKLVLLTAAVLMAAYLLDVAPSEVFRAVWG